MTVNDHVNEALCEGGRAAPIGHKSRDTFSFESLVRPILRPILTTTLQSEGSDEKGKPARVAARKRRSKRYGLPLLTNVGGKSFSSHTIGCNCNSMCLPIWQQLGSIS